MSALTSEYSRQFPVLNGLGTPIDVFRVSTAPDISLILIQECGHIWLGWRVTGNDILSLDLLRENPGQIDCNGNDTQVTRRLVTVFRMSCQPAHTRARGDSITIELLPAAHLATASASPERAVELIETYGLDTQPFLLWVRRCGWEIIGVTDPEQPYAKGTPVWASDDTEKGHLTGGTRPCSLESCRGQRLAVRWPDSDGQQGSLTYPCTAGMEFRQDGWHITSAGDNGCPSSQ